MKSYCQAMGIRQIKTSPYHPQTDGMVERFNATLKTLIRKLTQNPGVEWDACLPYLLYAYRGTVHRPTGFSPYQMLFGRVMRMPLDTMVRFWKGKEESGENTSVEFVQALKSNIEVVRELALERETKEKKAKNTTMIRRLWCVSLKWETMCWCLGPLRWLNSSTSGKDPTLSPRKLLM